MRRGIIERIVLGAVCIVAMLATTVGQTVAATKQAKELAPAVAVAKPAKQQSVQGEDSPIQRAKKSPRPTALERQSEAIQKPAKTALTEPKPVNPKSSQPVSTELRKEVIQAQAKLEQTDLKPTKPRSSRHMNVHRKRAPKAVVQPRTDLMYHGMLESSQRYDPRRNHRGAGVPDPHNPELTHDHFQELDRNQDGTIDPVERTVGRPDMDRDLYDRRPR
jgi:hypothetical protein